jgi:hypothetical protein
VASELKIETLNGRTSYAPGEVLDATAEWRLDGAAEAIEFRLLWSTRGDAEPDMSIVETVRMEMPGVSGTRRWLIQLPNGPYSFVGNLFSLVWSLELIVEPAGDTHRLEITVAPRGNANLLLPEMETT